MPWQSPLTLKEATDIAAVEAILEVANSIDRTGERISEATKAAATEVANTVSSIGQTLDDTVRGLKDTVGILTGVDLDQVGVALPTEPGVFNRLGFDCDGLYMGRSHYCPRGFDSKGFHHITKTKYDRHGFSATGLHFNGTRYDEHGFNVHGRTRSGKTHNEQGVDRYGLRVGGAGVGFAKIEKQYLEIDPDTGTRSLVQIVRDRFGSIHRNVQYDD